MGEDDPARTASVTYLKREVGPVLAQAFSELTIAQPTDSIVFLGEWLDTYVRAQQQQQLVEEEAATLKADRKAHKELKAKIAAEKKAIADAIAAKEQGVTAISEDLDAKYVTPGDEAAAFVFPEATEEVPDPPVALQPAGTVGPFEQLYSDLAEKAQALTGARGVYIAKVENGEVIHFTYTAKGTSDIATNIVGELKYTHDFMMDVTYKKEGEEEGAGTNAAIWSAFVPKEPEEPAEGEEAAGPTSTLYEPLNITDVVDDPRVKFVSITRLGSLLVLPIVYDDCCSPEAMAEAATFLQGKKAAIAEAKTAYAEFEATPPPEDPDAEPVEPPPKPEEVATSMKATPLTGSGAVMAALCIDTVGTEVQVSDKYVAMLDKAAKSVAEYRKRYDTYAVYQQAAVLETMSEEEKAAKAEAYKAAVAGVDEAIEAAFAEKSAELADAQQDELDRAKLAIKLEKYKALVVEQKDALVAYGTLAVVKPVAAKAYAALALCAGMEPTAVLAQGTGTPVWEKMKFSLAALLDKALTVEPTGPRTGLAPRAKLEFYTPLVEGLADEIAACAEMPEIQPVLLLAETAVALRTIDCKLRAAAEDFVPGSDDDIPEAPPAEGETEG
jgi:hypothetical protein